MKLLDLESHCMNLYSVLSELSYTNSADWFRIASGIKNIEFDGMVKDSSFTMCRPSYEYEVEKNKLHTKIVNQITFFNFIWSGLESLIDELDFDPCPARTGKINQACYFLKSEYEPLNFNLRHFENMSFKLLAHLKIIKSSDLLNRYKLSDCVSKAGMPLYTIYKLRNQFAHGVFNFPEPKDWNNNLKEPEHAEFIKTSSILVLMSIQMLIIGKFKNSKLFVYRPYESSQLWKEDSMLVSDYLKLLHIERDPNDYNPDQFLLKLE